MKKVLLSVGLGLLSLSPAWAEPVERHGFIASYGVGGLPVSVLNTLNDPDPEKRNNYYFKGRDVSLTYIHYGKYGYKGVFSSRYTLDWFHMTTFPTIAKAQVSNMDRFTFNADAILTAFPGAPVNFYFGFGVGLSVGMATYAEKTTDTTTGQTILKPSVTYIAPLPPIHLPIGINVRIRNILINVEAGLRDIVPYVTGGIGVIFGKSEYMQIEREYLPAPSTRDTGTIRGRVLDRATHAPLGRAVVELRGTGATDLSTKPRDGSFMTPDLKPGAVTLVASHEGYAPGALKAEVLSGTTVTVSILLGRTVQPGAVSGRAADPAGRPVAAVISIVRGGPGPGAGLPVTAPILCDTTTGEFFTRLAAGTYTLTASLRGYRSRTLTAAVKDGMKTTIQFVMEPLAVPAPAAPPAPLEKKPKAFIEKQKIVITERIHFGVGRANILPVSYSLLDDVADVLGRNPSIRIRVEGHTDNVGKDETNRRLSQARADSVMKYLVTKGIAPERIAARGYGASRPVADNSTPEGRARNRRVEFAIAGP